MQFTATALIAISAAFVAAEARQMTWQCHMNCGKALTAYNKCKGNSDMKNCLCASGSDFNSYIIPCLNCGDNAWLDYGSALTTPMKQCGMTTPAVKDTSSSSSSSFSTSDDSAGQKKLVKKAKKAIKKAKEKQEKADEKMEKYLKKLDEKGEAKAAGALKDAKEAQEDADEAVEEAKEKAADAGIDSGL